VDNWLADGDSQGWSQRTLADRRQAMKRFCGWLENVEQAPLTLASLSPAVTPAYLRDPAPDGRWAGEHHATTRRVHRPQHHRVPR
jgi:hypothetical protein